MKTIHYVLYVHFNEKKEKDLEKVKGKLAGLDWDSFNNSKTKNYFFENIELDCIKRINRFKDDLKELLQKGQEGGVLILFYDAGLRDLLENIHPVKFDYDKDSKDSKEEIKKNLFNQYENLKFGKVVGELIKKFAKDGLEDNIKILTSLDMVDIFTEMSDVQELRDFFIGEPGNIGYDSPKIVDAIVRLRLLGSSIPVFRLDQDVLFPCEDEDIKKSYECLKNAIGEQLNWLEKHHVTHNIHSTILSQKYEEPDKASGRPHIAYSRAYATRIQPSLLVKEDLINKNTNWKEYASTSFNLEVTKEFFKNKNIMEWGAPTTAVISGALLYMTDGVVLSVPPFSNFSLNVLWIDDHLRYALHRELGEFAEKTLTDRSGDHLWSQGRKEVIKCRIGFDNLVYYTLCIYLPQLLWGSIVDAWISIDPLLKIRKIDAESLGVDEEWKESKEKCKNGMTRGILTKEIKHAQLGRALRDEVKLREKLREEALDRIEKVREIWSKLKTEEYETFASCWAKGRVPEKLIDLIDDGKKKEIARGLPEKIVVGSQLGDQLERLITDAVNYLRWVQKWPYVVQVVRSVKRGVLSSDILN